MNNRDRRISDSISSWNRRKHKWTFFNFSSYFLSALGGGEIIHRLSYKNRSILGSGLGFALGLGFVFSSQIVYHGIFFPHRKQAVCRLSIIDFKDLSRKSSQEEYKDIDIDKMNNFYLKQYYDPRSEFKYYLAPDNSYLDDRE